MCPAEEAPCFSSYSQPEIKKIEVAVNYMYRKLYGKYKGVFFDRNIRNIRIARATRPLAADGLKQQR